MLTENIRRVDLLAEDLSLDNKREESLAKKKKKKQKKAQKPSRTTVKKVTADLNFHYIAFVPVSGQLWELDGMYKKPLCLGISSRFFKQNLPGGKNLFLTML